MIDRESIEVSVLLEIRARVKSLQTEKLERKKKLNGYSNIEEIMSIDGYIDASDEVTEEIDDMIKERRG